MRLSDYSQSGGRGLFRRDRRLFDQRGTYTFTVPDGVTKIWAFAIGAGGGGGKHGHASNASNWGLLRAGSGGGYASGIISGLTPGGTLTLTVGLGGNGAFENTAAAAGANTTVVGSGTTYLQGNGGQAASNTLITSDPGNQKGQGGAASTNSVTDAYTAAGGGGSTWPAGLGYTEVAASDQSHVSGGGGSGTPWGTGSTCSKAVGHEYIAAGGGGWCQDTGYRHPHIVPYNNGEYRMGEGVSLAGMGSHQTPKQLIRSYDGFRGEGGNGGKGRTAHGGTSISMAYWKASTNQDYNYNSKQENLHRGRFPSQIPNIYEYLDGQNGNPNWWFPWEIDGGGGGAMHGSSGSTYYKAGDGGPGAGGGGMSGSGSNTAMAHGGRGGFGGGGGGSRLNHSNINYMGYSQGGHGGNGGGGGSAYGRIESRGGTTLHMPIGGNGGDGAVGIYW